MANTTNRVPIICAIALLGLLVEPVTADEFHTSPYCWAEARIYASGETGRLDVSIARIESEAAFEGTPSPNGAYKFHITGRLQDADAEWHPRLLIFNERPYSLELRFPDTDAISAAEWVNENLIFIRLWWGRVAGSDFIVDVEKESIVYHQPVRYGAIAFQQFKQCSEDEWKDEKQCQCFDATGIADLGPTDLKDD